MRLGVTLFAAVLLFLAISRDVHAYLDPGAGSVFLQALLAAVAVAAVTLKYYWYRILKLFGLNRQEAGESDKRRPAEDNQP